MPIVLALVGLRCVQDFFTAPKPPSAVPKRLAFKVQPSAATAGAPFSVPIQVAVEDSLGKAVPGAATSITIAITSGTGPSAAKLRGPTAVNAVNGVATFAGLSVDSAAAGYSLTANATGLTSATSSPFIVNPAPPTKLAFTVQPSNTSAGASIAPAVQVAVVDSLGNRVTTATNSVTLALGTNPGGDTLAGTKTVAALNGIVTFSNLVIKKAGAGYTLTAQATGLGGFASATSSAFNVTVGLASRLGFTVQPSNTVAGQAITPAVQVAVQDSVGNTVATATNTITVAITSGTGASGATLSGTTTASAVNGVATFSNLSINKAATGYTLTATATGPASGTSSTFAITPGPPSKLGFAVQPSNAPPGGVISPAVQVAVQDAFGNTVPTATNTITVAIGTNLSGGTLSGTTAVSAGNGVATFANLSIDKVGAGYTLIATATGLTSATSAPFDVTVRKLAFSVQPSSATAGVPISPAVQVTVQDSLGNTVTTATNSITLAITTGTGASGATLLGTTTVNAVNGVATFSDLRIKKAGTGYTLTAIATGLTGATSTAFNITAAPASQLGFIVGPSTTTAGTPITPAVQVAVQDSVGNTVTTATSSISVAITSGTGASGAALSGTTTVSAASGVATFANLAIKKAGTGYTLTATATGLTAATSAAFDITVALASPQLAFTVQPSNAAAGAAITPAVQVAVQDSVGNTVTTATNSITVAIASGTGASGATLSGTTTASAVSGVATFSSLSINKAGTGYTLTAAATGLTAVTSSAFDITPGTATRLAFVVQPSNALAGTAITPAVQVAVQDNLGNTVTSATNSVTVAIGVNPASGTLSGTTTVSAVNGVASFANLSINNAGTGYTLTATATGLSSSGSSSFDITLYKLAFTVQPSTTVAGVAITPAVQVAIQDASGNTVTSATNSITMAIGNNPGTGFLSGTTTAAAVSGVATFSNLSINRTGTGYTLRATGASLTGATSTAFDITPGPASRVAFTVQPSNATAGVAFSPAVQVAVQDALGNTVTSATNSITVAIGTNPSGGTLLGTKVVSAVSGVATFSSLRIDKAATGYTLTASASNLTGATSSSFNITVAPASRVAFIVQPTNTVAGAAIAPAVQVAVQDSMGNTVTAATTSVTVAIGTNPSAGTLSGTTTVSAVSGVATFANLSIDKTGTGYTLAASATGLSGATSNPFNVVAPVTVSTGTLSAGFLHSCALTAAGAAFCWGYNNYGQLGNGSAVTSPTPVPVSGSLVFSSVSAARSGSNYYYAWHTCGVTTTGAAYCWGYNSYGQLGNGSFTGSSVPVLVSGGLTFAAVSAGERHTCGVTTGGAAYCWGNNQESELGNGNTTTSTTPVAVGGGLTFASVSAGSQHTCGLTTSGAAYCWGFGGLGELGNGTTTNSTTPVPVSGALTFTALSAGGDHTCGVTTTGAAYCWGYNYYGQLGNGSSGSNSLVPVLVSGGLTFAAVSAGGLHSCGITPSATAYCWGRNSYGQLANGSLNGTTTPAAVASGFAFASVSAGGQHSCGLTTGGTVYCWGDEGLGELGNGSTAGLTTPVPVSSGFSMLSSGAAHTCAATAGGTAYCWGRGDDGQLGNGSINDQTTPVPVTAGVTFTSVDAGGRHSCAVASGGAAYCWGFGGNGQLGTGATTNSTTPTAVSGSLTFVSVDAGDLHTCGVASSGTASCWGQGDLGQLGSGSFTSSTSPVAVTGVTNFGSVSAGYRHSCGVNLGGSAYCWGSNSSGQLGNGSTAASSASPVLVANFFNLVSVSAGQDYSCGVTTAGVGLCWGANGAGQLGNNSTTSSNIPVGVSGGLTFASIKADSAHTCGVTTGGAVYCWGANVNGELGNNTTTNTLVPVRVSTPVSVAAATTGNQFSCGLATNGAASCWGVFAEGRLGNGSTGGSTTPVPVAGGLTFKVVAPFRASR